MDPRNQQQPLPPPPFINPFLMHWCEGFYAGSLYQGMAQQHLYRPPSSGPHRNQPRKGPQMAEAPYRYNLAHESPGTIAGDRSTGINPGYAQIGANGNTRAGKVWRTPSRTPLMADHNSTPQKRTKPYNRDRSRRNRKSRYSRTDKVDPSEYEIPIMGSQSTSIRYRFAIHPLLIILLMSLCRRCDGRWSNAQTSHAVNMEDCPCTINTCGCIDVDRDYKK